MPIVEMQPSRKTQAKTGAAIGGGAAIVGLFSAAVISAATPEIQKWEGRRNYPYYDIVRVLTVCDGETHNVQMRQYSNSECDAMTGKRMRIFADAITPCLPPTLPVQIQVAVLVTSYNIGARAFCSSSISRNMKAGKLVAGCQAIRLYNKARIGGKLTIVKGLDRRRRAESALCLQGAYG